MVRALVAPPTPGVLASLVKACCMFGGLACDYCCCSPPSGQSALGLLLAPVLLYLRSQVVFHVRLLVGSFHGLCKCVREFPHEVPHKEGGPQATIEGKPYYLFLHPFDFLDLARETIHVLARTFEVPLLGGEECGSVLRPPSPVREGRPERLL